MARSSPHPSTPQSLPRLTTAALCPSTHKNSLLSTQSRAPITDAQLARINRHGRQDPHLRLNRDPSAVLQNPMLLQEDGRLAAKLDHVSYLLDGLIESLSPPTMRLAQTRSLLELLQVMQDPEILQTIALSSLKVRIKELLLSSFTKPVGEKTARLALSVLVYILSHCAEAADYFDEHVLTAIVHALRQEFQGKNHESIDTIVSDTKTSRKKCLKRKQTEVKLLNSSSGLETSTVQVMDAMCRMKLDKLLQDHEEFYAGDELHVTVTTALCAALHKLLQVDAKASSHLPSLYEQHSSDSTQALHGIQVRKRQLMQSGGLDVLAKELGKQVKDLETLLRSTRADDVMVDCTLLLHHIYLVLNVLGQAACQVVDVKHYVSEQKNLFVVLLHLIELLSELSWNGQAQRKWKAVSSRMLLAVDVLLETLRVLINLTHHDNLAASHVHAFGGMQTFVNAFSRLCGMASAEQSWTQKKWGFDACLLLLSVIVNSIEYSEVNRDALAQASEYRIELSREETGRNACALFVEFFLSKIQSYKHLIDGSESQAAANEEDDDWNPDDVILGGCTSLLLGYLMKDSDVNSAAILKSMPGSSPQLLLRALGVYVAFHSQIGALTPEVVKSVLLVEKILKSCDGSAPRPNNIDMLETMTVKSEATRINFSAADSARSKMRPPSRRARPLRDVCSRLDESDEDTEFHIQDKREVVRGIQKVGLLPTAHGPVSRKHTPEMSLIQVSSLSVSSEMDACRYSPIAIHPDGSMSSPVVARLLKNTRQLIEEFDTKFASLSRPSPIKKLSDFSERRTAATKDSAPLAMVLTMDVTSCDNGNDNLDLSKIMVGTNVKSMGVTKVGSDQEIRSVMPWKRKKKPTRGPETNANTFQKTSFQYISGTPPSTPLRVKKSKMLVETPTKARRTPDVYRQSPSLNLTPTKSSPATPVWMRKSLGLLKTPVRKDQSPLQKNTPMSAYQHRRKVKVVRLPTSTSTCTSSVFDFTD